MKNRLHDKKAGIVILAALFVISLVDVLLRATVFSTLGPAVSNHGEAMVTAIFSIILMLVAIKGKDRVFYILCGVWLSYFMLNQLYTLPGYVSNFVKILSTATEAKPMGTTVMILYIVSILGIIGIGALLVEYMNDGTIYNKAFNALCFITFFSIIGPAVGDAVHILFQSGEQFLWLSVLNNLQRCTMIFLFTFFAYDSAKAQLAKTNLDR